MIREQCGKSALSYDDGQQYGWGLRAQGIPTINDVLAADRWRIHDMLGVWSGAIGVAEAPLAAAANHEKMAAYQRAYRKRKKEKRALKKEGL